MHTVTRPPIARVTILWSENAAIGSNQIFRSLDAADAYIAHALAVQPPPSEGGYDKTAFQLVWTDGYRYQGRADITERNVGRHVLRDHVARACRQRIAWFGQGIRGVTADDAGFAREILRRVEPPPFSDDETLPGTAD
jgi:hypothetical protein